MLAKVVKVSFSVTFGTVSFICILLVTHFSSQPFNFLFCVFHSVPIFDCVLLCFSVRHDNQVGRWLTSFRATWDPKFDKYAVVGSMRRPRQVGMSLCPVILHFISFLTYLIF